jgi:hypothetical protein
MKIVDKKKSTRNAKIVFAMLELQLAEKGPR